MIASSEPTSAAVTACGSFSGLLISVTSGGPGTRGTRISVVVMNESGATYAGCSGSGHCFGRSHTTCVGRSSAGGPSIGARTWTSQPGCPCRYSTRCRVPAVTSSG